MTPKQLKQHKCRVLHTGIGFRGPESPCVSGQNCSTFLDLGFINSKMDRLNQKIFHFPSSLMFNDSNRKSHPYPYHVLQLNVNKKNLSSPNPFLPFFFLYPKMSSSPYDCYRKQYQKEDPLLSINPLSEISFNCQQGRKHKCSEAYAFPA